MIEPTKASAPGLPGPSVSSGWLAANLGQPGLVVLDGSWYLPAMQRDATREFRDCRIPGARFFDIDRCSDPLPSLPHTLPAPEHFKECAEEAGVSDSSSVVVYDASGVNLSAPRVWWTFRYFGLKTVALLDGGLGHWRRLGYATESGEPGRSPAVNGSFTPVPRSRLLRTREDMMGAIAAEDVQIVDMRPPGRFVGFDPEPRVGLRRGHIPGSRNVPYTALVDPGTGRAVSNEALLRLLSEAGVDPAKDLVGTCGSGTTACAFAWSMARSGYDDVAVYDGSWSEWGSREDLPVETGPAAVGSPGDESGEPLP